MLGPHHSGTSIVAKALDLTGFYLGEAEDLLHSSMCMGFRVCMRATCCTAWCTAMHGMLHLIMHHAMHRATPPATASVARVSRLQARRSHRLSRSGHRRLQEDNPLKYWERRDAVAINKARIGTAQGGGHVAVPSFVGYGFEPAQGLPLDPSPVIAALEGSGRSWATKDPRLSLTASEWLPHLTTDRTRPPPVRPLV